jgi:hypothetical protein
MGHRPSRSELEDLVAGAGNRSTPTGSNPAGKSRAEAIRPETEGESLARSEADRQPPPPTASLEVRPGKSR